MRRIYEVLIGGSKGKLEQIVANVDARLNPGGRLAANFIRLENTVTFRQLLQQYGISRSKACCCTRSRSITGTLTRTESGLSYRRAKSMKILYGVGVDRESRTINLKAVRCIPKRSISSSLGPDLKAGLAETAVQEYLHDKHVITFHFQMSSG
jgi:hypothetical protein